MNQLSLDKRAAIVRALTEGCSIRATARMVGVSKDTVAKLLVDFGEFCSIYQDYKLRKLTCARIEADEIWSFCQSKERNVRPEHKGVIGYGDLWTFTAMCADSKLMVSWFVGQRTVESAETIMRDVQSRLANRPQLTTDGHGMYLPAVAAAFHWKTKGVDFAQLVKSYGQDPDFEKQQSHRRYSPAVCTGAEKIAVFGKPDMSKVSTSYIERSNLTMRMQMRRFTRLTNGFSRKAQNHAYAVSAFYMIYNFARPHMTLCKQNGRKTTPAMAAGLADHVWTVEEILGLMDPARLLQSN